VSRSDYHLVLTALSKRGGRATVPQLARTSPAGRLSREGLRNAIRECRRQDLIITDRVSRKRMSRKVIIYAPRLRTIWRSLVESLTPVYLGGLYRSVLPGILPGGYAPSLLGAGGQDESLYGMPANRFTVTGSPLELD